MSEDAKGLGMAAVIIMLAACVLISVVLYGGL